MLFGQGMSTHLAVWQRAGRWLRVLSYVDICKQHVNVGPLMEPAFADLACGRARGKRPPPTYTKLCGYVGCGTAFSYLGTLQTPEGEASFAGSPFVPHDCYAPGVFKFCGAPNMGAAEGRTVHHPKM